MGLLFGVKAPTPGLQLAKSTMPRLWYLAPGSEAAGLLAAAE
jgi:hypothetical protein